MNKQPASQSGTPSPSVTQRVWRYGPLVLWLLFISFASTSGFSAANTSQIFRPLLLWLFPTLSESRLETLHFLVRKMGHFTEYGMLGFFAWRAFVTSSNQLIQRRWFQLGLGLVVIYALLDEFHQRFEPTRTGSLYDSGIDVAGGLTVLLLCKLFGAKSQRQKSGM
jgi:VanZ family protein